MNDQSSAEELATLQRWVDTWRAAGPEIEAIRRREIESADTCEAARQIFGGQQFWPELPPRLTSGLVEQQAWFARLRHDTAI